MSRSRSFTSSLGRTVTRNSRRSSDFQYTVGDVHDQFLAGLRPGSMRWIAFFSLVCRSMTTSTSSAGRRTMKAR